MMLPLPRTPGFGMHHLVAPAFRSHVGGEPSGLSLKRISVVTSPPTASIDAQESAPHIVRPRRLTQGGGMTR